ncbi:MAG: EFR1 family ferrodoxin [Eubacteriales bacterium]
MRIVIFYFSGTGNTKWVADRMANALTANGKDAESISIEAISKNDIPSMIDAADMVGFAYPIYGSDIPEPMKAFMTALPQQNTEKPTFVFCTQMMFSGDGAFVFRKELKSKDYRIVYSEHYMMPNNISMFSWLPLYGKRLHAFCLKHTEKRINRIAKQIALGKKHVHIRMGYVFGIMQRAPFRQSFEKNNKGRDALGVNESRCISCERCARICPVNNIIMQGKHPEWQGKCILCTRCYNFCPTGAITYNGKSHILKHPLYTGPENTFKPEQLKKR